MALMSIATPPHIAPPRTPLADLVSRAAAVAITIEQYQRMIDEGIVGEDSSVELLRGVLVRKDRSVIGEDPMGHSPLHRVIIALLTTLTTRINNNHRHLQIQLPIACPPDGNPEPDAAIIRGNVRDYTDRLPGLGDVFCVIEVAHSSLERDREEKLPIYAEASVPQYILINLQNDTIEVYSDSDPAAGVYRTKATFTRGNSLRLHLGDGEWLEVAAAELLP